MARGANLKSKYQIGETTTILVTRGLSGFRGGEGTESASVISIDVLPSALMHFGALPNASECFLNKLQLHPNH